MPSVLHEAPLVLIREDPLLVPRLLRDGCGIELRDDVVARVVDADATQVIPLERLADAVVTLEDERGTITSAFVIEVQLGIDPAKRFSWPLYLAAIHERHRCSSRLVVFSPFEHVARWAAQPIDTFQPTSGFAPIVLGPGQIPRIEDHAAASAHPELALLSAFVHGAKPGGEAVIDAAFRAAASLDEDHAKIYSDLAVAVLGDVARPILERLMPYLHGYTLKSDWAKGHFSEGERQGKLEGKLEAERGAILIAARARGIELSKEGRERVETCADAAMLETWLQRAVTATDESQIW